MSIGEDILNNLPFLRQQAESLHTDTFKVTRGGSTSWDPDQGQVITPGQVIKAEIRGRMRPPSMQEKEPLAGDHQWSISDVVWQVAASTTGIEIGDVVECTNSPDGVNIGGKFTIVQRLTGSQLSSARFVMRRTDA